MQEKLTIDSPQMAEVKQALNSAIDDAIKTTKDGSTSTINLKIECQSFTKHEYGAIPDEKEIDSFKYSVNVVQKKEIEKTKGNLKKIFLKNIGGKLIPYEKQIVLEEVFEGRTQIALEEGEQIEITKEP